MKLFRNLFKKKQTRNDLNKKLERIGLVYVKEMKSNRKLRRKLEGTRMNAIINQIINE